MFVQKLARIHRGIAFFATSAVSRIRPNRRVFAARFAIRAAVCLLAAIVRCPPAFAYIGPGAGFVFVGSFLILLVTSVLVVFSLLTWPARCAARAVRRRKIKRRHRDVGRIVILGLDGLKPELAERFMDEGRLPNMARLRERGTFTRLNTTYPAISPVAWSSFQTGTNPGKHNIFDFLSRDPATYLPLLSSVKMGKVERSLSLGSRSIPLGKPTITPLRKSRPFWHVLGEHGVSSCVLRVPVTFPPEKHRGVMLCGMCVPDLIGTQGTFTVYTTRDDIRCEHGSGIVVRLEQNGNIMRSHITGPENFLRKDREPIHIPLQIVRGTGADPAEVTVGGQRVKLTKGKHSDWVRLRFSPGLGMKVTGVCRFLLVEADPHLTVYMTPMNIDPDRPALPVSHPMVYSSYLSKLLGTFSTLGLAEDTWALSEGVIDETAFLEQCYTFHGERERIFFNALDRTGEDVCISVFDITDRVQHMFWRYLDESHPANRGKDTERYAGAITELYNNMDGLVGRTLERLNERDILIVMSDHGFQPFSRGVNVNSWLHQNGYLALNDGATESGEWFADVDWTRTKAYAMGLGGLYINERGREAQGTVAAGDEKRLLKEELIERLSGLRDTQQGQIGITQLWDTTAVYAGPYLGNAPDLIVGYAAGYRASWDSVTGKIGPQVFEDNVMSWCGDHCIDPRLVPGVFFSSRAINAHRQPHIMDIAPTVLAAFGIDRPGHMDGTALDFE